MTSSVENPDPSEPLFEPLPDAAVPPVVLLSPPMKFARPLRPKQRLQHFSPDEWEEFIYEWARALGEPYVDVARFGGANDRGADVAAFFTEQGAEGLWDCYQCKHYEKALTAADAYPEMLKIFVAVVLKHYVMPRRYVFVAPKTGTGLTKLLAQPSKLKTQFFATWHKAGSKLTSGIDATVLTKAEQLAQETDFSCFKAGNLDDILEIHATTRHHAFRFGTELPDRPAAPTPPEETTPSETQYVRKLLDVYVEKYGMRTWPDVKRHHKAGDHFQRQREAFYAAESLRVFARDHVPDGTYEKLEKEIFDGVVEVEQDDFGTGYARLNSVLKAATHMQLQQANILTNFVDTNDRKGLCHQLANDGHLTWCQEESR
ncbi:hypothetical protein GCM10027176_30990 [Actinoallomurus bryophytorum]|uniref:ABC-three component systems C-terminal domain-containing protein n=1 Tax=Actinoallomurus bryophytorum TaxID=1490222 RepID=A0A543CG45_9ACTN|nr:ABC-three component system protein [Actinoallomurus bryophytorum]TQL96048.1 hypothetical protein FB559_1567 [Actinoallomurus bryophytorum]